jgi:hypothetical protein
MDGALIRRARSRAGVTMIELLLATGMASIVMLGLTYVMLPLVRAQVLSARGQTVQLNLAAAWKTADLEISQASWLLTPSLPGAISDRLEGCQNATAPASGAPSVPLDAGQPMRWFALCPADGRLFYHTGGGCPPAYTCGVDPTSSFGGGTAPQAQASFVRASTYTTVVEIGLSMTSVDSSGSLRSAASFAGAAGTVQ